jgi:AcrR family transcriptional regulator
MAGELARSRLTRAESRQRTRESLVASAMRVFARAGYAGASVDAIAEEAGFSVGALYSNFATKEELFLAALERHCAEELAELKALSAAAHSRHTLLAAVAQRFTVLDDRHREWWQLWAELWLYAQRHPHAVSRLRAVQDEARAVIAEALGGGPAGHNRLHSELAAAVHALWGGFMLYRLVNPDAVTAEAFGRAVEWLVAGHATHHE